MAEKTIVVDIDIKAEDIRAANDAMAQAAKSSAMLTVELNKLKEDQKQNNKLYKEGAISATELAARQAGLKLQMTEVSKSLRDSNKEYANNKTVVDAAKGSNEQLKARLSLLTTELNKMSDAQRYGTQQGKQLDATVLALTDKLKTNEKAVGDNRRNVGNYTDSVKEALEASGGFGKNLVGMASGLRSATAASLKFLATPLGAVIGAIGLAIGLVVGGFKLMTASLNRTEDGAAALTGVMNVFKGVMSGVLTVVEPIALFLVEGLANGFESLGNMVESSSKQIEKALRFLGLNDAANGLKKVTDTVKETSAATAQLAKAEAELNKIQREQGILQLESQNRAEKLRQIRDDESKSIKERIQANKDLADVLTEQSDAELALANRALEIANLRIKADGASSENLDKLAEAELKIAEIEERITSQRSEQMTNENSLRRDGIALIKEANDAKIKALKEETEAEKEAQAELIKRFEDQRALIDQTAEMERNQAIINIANAEQQAEAIAFIEKEALLEKLRSIEDETVAYTASADAIGAIDEEKYAKQLAERAKYEAELAAIDRAAKAKAFTEEVDYLAKQEQLEIENAEFSIQNADDLEKKKAEISLKYLELKLKLMRENAMLDGVLTKEEIQNLQLVENQIKRMINLIKGGGEDGDGVPTLADMLGLSDEDLQKIQTGIGAVTQVLQGVQSLVAANAESRLQEIEQQSQAEIQAVESSALSEEQKAAKIQAINKKAAEEKYKIELEQFKTGKALQIALAVANTATAVMAQLSNPTPYAGFVLAALAAATGAIQIATIASQKPPAAPKFADGGILSGASHSQGGIQLYGSSGDYYGEAEGGEPILTKAVSQNPYLLQKASEINVAAGGKPLVPSSYMASGGIASPTFAARQASTNNNAQLEMQIATLGDRIEQMQPVVRVTDINRINSQSVKVQQSADL